MAIGVGCFQKASNLSASFLGAFFALYPLAMASSSASLIADTSLTSALSVCLSVWLCHNKH